MSILVLDGVSKNFGGLRALDTVDLVVEPGEIVGLIGPNGAGKTTLLSILAGLRRPTSGSVTVAVPKHRIGVLVDTPQFEPWLTAHEVVDLARHLTAPQAPAERIMAALTETGLSDGADRRVGGFSRGMLQRLGLAACLVGDPDLLLLDEPVSALDPAGRREVLDLIGRLAQTKTVLLSTHILADVQQVCDTVAVIDHGQLRYQGPLATLLARTSTAYALRGRPPADGLVAALRREPWLTEVTEQAAGRLRLVVRDPGQAEQRVPQLLAEHNHALVSFQPATDLETAFLELTS
jgi:ABC-2 type transport system ATP-binding protein